MWSHSNRWKYVNFFRLGLCSGSHDVSVTDGRRNSCIRDEGSLSRSASDSSMTQQQQQQQSTNINHSQISPNATLLPNHHGSVFWFVTDFIVYFMYRFLEAYGYASPFFFFTINFQKMKEKNSSVFQRNSYLRNKNYPFASFLLLQSILKWKISSLQIICYYLWSYFSYDVYKEIIKFHLSKVRCLVYRNNFFLSSIFLWIEKYDYYFG